MTSWSLVRASDIGGSAVRWPREIASLFDERRLVGQFRLSRSSTEPPEGWLVQQLGQWFLSFHERVPVVRIVSGGVPVGWLLGEPIGDQGVVSSEFEVGADADEFERALHGLGGRFVAVWLGQRGARLFLDASGSMGVVYCAEQQIVASSVFLIPYLDEADDRLALVDDEKSPGFDPHLYFGLTVRHSVEWLMPNHYLDLESWQSVRYWPRGAIETTDDVEGALKTVVSRLTGGIRALVEAGPLQMSLTAGNDTRALLACAREFIDEIEFVTIALPDRTGRTDVSVARYMARKLGLRHRVIPWRRPSAREVDLLLYRTGCAAALDARCQEGVKMMAAMDPNRSYVSAATAEVARMPSFVTLGPEPRPVTIEKVLAWRQQPQWPELLERGERWVAGLSALEAINVFDMRALEMRFGGWDGFLSYGYPEGQAGSAYPFSDRLAFEAMLSFPLEYRLANHFTRDVIARQWPELSEFPINEARNGWYGTYRNVRRLAKRALRR